MKTRSPLIFLFLVPALSARAQTSEIATGRLGSTIFNWENLAPKPNATGLRREVTDLATATFERFESHITTLDPGKISHPPHRHPREELIVIKDGTLEVSINGQARRAGPGSLLFYASNDLHNVTNIGATPATYLVFNFSTAATASAPAGGRQPPPCLASWFRKCPTGRISKPNRRPAANGATSAIHPPPR